MIIQSPEPCQPEPYNTYTGMRAAKLAERLGDIVGETDLQLCTRAVRPDEVRVTSADAIVYGCVVRDLAEGYKSVLYGDEGSEGMLAQDLPTALTYAKESFRRGERIRIKDPKEVDGRGQITAKNLSEVEETVTAYSKEGAHGLVLMPHIDVCDRLSFGRINLGRFGKYIYAGREHQTHNGRQNTHGGADIVLGRTDDTTSLKDAASRLGIAPEAYAEGVRALNRCDNVVVYSGRISVDVLCGTTDSGRPLQTAVDFTPRVGTITPAEVESIHALNKDPDARLAHTSVRLQYNLGEYRQAPTDAIRYVDTPTLMTTVRVTAVE